MAEYEKWLEKAREDLEWTGHNIKAGVYYGACFSAQQSAEKSLKAFLLSHKKRLRKVHDVLALLEDCITIDPKFESLRHQCAVLFPYYIETRYPDLSEFVEFDQAKADEAFNAADKILEFVENVV